MNIYNVYTFFHVHMSCAICTVAHTSSTYCTCCTHFTSIRVRAACMRACMRVCVCVYVCICTVHACVQHYTIQWLMCRAYIHMCLLLCYIAHVTKKVCSCNIIEVNSVDHTIESTITVANTHSRKIGLQLIETRLL